MRQPAAPSEAAHGGSAEERTTAFLREAIATGGYLPGRHLSLNEVARSVGVAPPQVRPSFRLLADEGLLHLAPFRGATVATVRPREVAEIYELRMLLEPYLLARAIPLLDEGVLRLLRSTADELEGCADFRRRLELRRTFYDVLYGCAGRPRALAQVRRLRASVLRFPLVGPGEEGRHSHRGLLRHADDRDVPGATAWLVDHLRSVSATLQRAGRRAG